MKNVLIKCYIIGHTLSFGNEKQAVLQFHCMAHVLLGFKRNVAEDLKRFRTEQIVYPALGIFGPTADHLGIIDRQESVIWEDYCVDNGTASEVFLHSKHLLKVIKTVQSRKQKILPVEADYITGPYWLKRNTVRQCMYYTEISDIDVHQSHWSILVEAEYRQCMSYTEISDIDVHQSHWSILVEAEYRQCMYYTEKSDIDVHQCHWSILVEADYS
ncbi:hypothetical protein MAR_026355 [Mya arenaria]|uniref:Uncharacterized protein n=1 Tax=Mya arenaria TaxID=6604 RepID=A0ABY7ESF3_MYAAR|nr:hypothetical protein MAR_026355 [Mya arenaria]